MTVGSIIIKYVNQLPVHYPLSYNIAIASYRTAQIFDGCIVDIIITDTIRITRISIGIITVIESKN